MKTWTLAATAASLAFAGCALLPGCKADPPGHVEWAKDGAQMVVGDVRKKLPAADLDANQVPSVESGSGHYAYATKSGETRLFYLVGKGLYVGPLVKGAPPTLDASLGELFRRADDRPRLIGDVRAARGSAGVVRMMAASANMPDHAWDEAAATLAPSETHDLDAALARSLESGEDKGPLRRAVTRVDLRARAASLAPRIREVAKEAPAPAAVMLRALAMTNADEAAKVGCETVFEPVTADERLFAEAAALAVSHGGGDCPLLERALGADYCRPFFRCNGDTPLTGRETTRQTEPLCSAQALTGAVTRELARSGAEVLGSSASRPELFAYAALAAKGHVPPAMVAAQARRLYAFDDATKAPVCERGLAPNQSCRCDEATVRDGACRTTGDKVAVGFCRFDVDPKAKSLGNVVFTNPP